MQLLISSMVCWYVLCFYPAGSTVDRFTPASLHIVLCHYQGYKVTRQQECLSSIILSWQDCDMCSWLRTEIPFCSMTILIQHMLSFFLVLGNAGLL